MYHDPRSDRHVGRHSRTQAAPAAKPAVVRDRHGRAIPAPPRATFGPGPYVTAAVGPHSSPDGFAAVFLVCWEALSVCDPAGLGGPSERREARYRDAAHTVAVRAQRSLSRPQARGVAEWIAAACAEHVGGTQPVLRGQTRRAAGWIVGSEDWRWSPRRAR